MENGNHFTDEEMEALRKKVRLRIILKLLYYEIVIDYSNTS